VPSFETGIHMTPSASSYTYTLSYWRPRGQTVLGETLLETQLLMVSDIRPT
jgi:hypothetical protein